MMMPRVFGESMFEEMEQSFERMFGWDSPTLFMQEENQFSTNVTEKDGKILVSMNLPGMEKQDIHAKLEHGYLTISASHKSESKAGESGANRTERRVTQFARSYYVGDQVKQEDIVAKFENGQLQLELPDIEAQKKVEEDPYIKIEG